MYKCNDRHTVVKMKVSGKQNPFSPAPFEIKHVVDTEKKIYRLETPLGSINLDASGKRRHSFWSCRASGRLIFYVTWSDGSKIELHTNYTWE